MPAAIPWRNVLLLLATSCWAADVAAQALAVSDHVGFQENKGQIADQHHRPRPDVLYGGTVNGLTYHLRCNGVSYQSMHVDAWTDEVSEPEAITTRIPDAWTVQRLDVSWPNAAVAPKVSASGPRHDVEHFYLAQCPEGAENVRTFHEVLYEDLYPGINLRWYFVEGALKYDYEVGPGADHTAIVHRITGADKISVNAAGELVIITPLDTIVEQAPVVMQEGERLSARWILKDNEASFHVEGTDPALPFVIDPVTRLWGTYYGGGPAQALRSVATDASGNIFSSDRALAQSTLYMISTAGSHQVNYAGGSGPDSWDGFLVKFSPTGARLWGTYYGGVKAETGFFTSTDPSGNVYLCGETASTSAIATAGSHKATADPFTTDAYLVKFNTNGIRQWGTYYGGTGNDYGLACATDPSGNVFLVGRTMHIGGTAIATVGSHQPVHGGGSHDGFVAKFNSSGVRQWGSYFGGTGIDRVTAVAADGFGNAYIGGTTGSTTGIATAGAHQTALNGINDGFLAKLDPNGVLQWATYYGGDGASDAVYGVAAHSTGMVYLAGDTNSNTGTGIASAGSHRTTLGSSADAFFAYFNGAGVRQWGTYYGGPNPDYGWCCAVDAAGNGYLGGYSLYLSGTDIATPGSHQPANAGYQDGFIARFGTNGVRQSASYYGGALTEYVMGCSPDLFGNIIICGAATTLTGTAIATPGSYQTIPTGGNNGFLAKLTDFFSPLPVELISFTADCAGGSALLRWATATETNNERFDVQRSHDGSVWRTIGTVAGAGHSQQVLQYTFRDTELANAPRYYRLFQVDHSGQTTPSAAVVLQPCGDGTLISEWVVDAAGRVCGPWSSVHGAVASGMYMVRSVYSDGTVKHTKRMVHGGR